MTKIKQLRQTYFAFAAPLILMGIACLQLYLTHTHHLTPWKGGGFGMFSTVDSQGARFLRIYLLTAEGEVPVEVPPSLITLAREVRYLPTVEHLSRLAQELAQATWVPANYNLSEQSLDSVDQQAPLLTDKPETTDPNDSTLINISSGDDANLASTDQSQPRFRIKEEYEPGPATNGIKIYGVRVELWRYNFVSLNRQIQAYKFLEVTINKTAPHSR